jgi:hypothetical protein
MARTTEDKSMHKNSRYSLILVSGVLLIFFAAGCSVPVLRQNIPVSTNPVGARIYADGQFVGSTPATVSLERNRSHILTLTRDNYRQEDVVITNLYQKEKVYLKAVQSGINSGLFFKNPSMGFNSGMNSISSQEDSGEAYILSPPVVTINLTPLDAATQPLQRFVADPTSVNAIPTAQPDMAKDMMIIGAGAATSRMAPINKTVTSSSSSKSYVTSDGTRVQEKTSTSVGVSVNPAGLVNVLNALFN